MSEMKKCIVCGGSALCIVSVEVAVGEEVHAVNRDGYGYWDGLKPVDGVRVSTLYAGECGHAFEEVTASSGWRVSTEVRPQPGLVDAEWIEANRIGGGR